MRQRLHDLWMPVSPAARLGMVRLLVGAYAFVYLTIRLPHLWSYGLTDFSRFVPVGVVTLGEAPTLPWLYRALVLLTWGLSMPFALGWHHRFLGIPFAGLLLWVLSYSNSWGMILHTDNLLMMHIIVLALAPAAAAVSLDARRMGIEARASRRYGWPLKLMVAIAVGVYFLAGVAKLRNSGMAFFDGNTLRNYVAWGNVRKVALGSHHSPIGVLSLGIPGFFGLLSGGSLLLELMAPVALVHRRLGIFWAAMIWAFHIGVLALMAIAFVYPLTFVAFLPLLECETWLERPKIRHWLRRLLPPEAEQTSPNEAKAGS